MSREGSGRIHPLCWAIPAAICLAIYWRGLLVWFQQDDFAWLALGTEVQTWPQFWRAMFAPMAQGTIRPWSERAFFMGLHALFGLDPLPFRIAVFATQLANLWLIASITRRITGSVVAATLAPALWIANSALVYVMTWSSVYNQALCAFGLLLAFELFLRHAESGRRGFYIAQWVVFLFGFGALEINLVYPAIALTYAVLRAPDQIRKTIPLFIPSIAFFLIHRMAAPKTAAPGYTMYFDTSIAATLWTYWQWVLGPARIKNIFIAPPWIEPAGTAIFSAALAGFALWQMRKRNWTVLFFLGWFIVTLAPILPLRDHLSDYYLTIPSIGLAMLAAWGISQSPKIVGATLLAGYLATTAPVSYEATRMSHKRSLRIENLLAGVAGAKKQHPGKIILLSGVDDELFWNGVLDNPFRLIGATGVYLSPESESLLTPHPELGQITEYTLPSAATLEALEKNRLAVYLVSGERLRNITSIYEKTARLQLKNESPRRVDVGNPLLEPLLGKTWHSREGAYRWMPRRATVRIGGPRNARERLYLIGFIPAAELDKGPVRLSVRAEAFALGSRPVEKGMERIEVDFELPAALVGKDTIELTIEVDRTFVPPADGRELGVAFGVFEIR